MDILKKVVVLVALLSVSILMTGCGGEEAAVEVVPVEDAVSESNETAEAAVGSAEQATMGPEGDFGPPAHIKERIADVRARIMGGVKSEEEKE